MAVAGSGLTGIATADLGLSLPDQVKAETDEDKKKRLAMMQQMSPGAMSALLRAADVELTSGPMTCY